MKTGKGTVEEEEEGELIDANSILINNCVQDNTQPEVEEKK